MFRGWLLCNGRKELRSKEIAANNNKNVLQIFTTLLDTDSMIVHQGLCEDGCCSVALTSVV